MGGFEQDYELALCNPVWGKALRSFREQEPNTDIAPLVEKAISNEMKHGQLVAIRALGIQYRDAFQQSQVSDLIHIQIDGANELQILEAFHYKCSSILNRYDTEDVNEQFCSMATERLCDLCISPERFTGTTPEQAAVDMVTTLLEHYVRDRLNAAVELCSRKTRESPHDVDQRLEDLIQAARIKQMVTMALKNEEKPVRAPQTKRLKAVKFLDMKVSLGKY